MRRAACRQISKASRAAFAEHLRGFLGHALCLSCFGGKVRLHADHAVGACLLCARCGEGGAFVRRATVDKAAASHFAGDMLARSGQCIGARHRAGGDGERKGEIAHRRQLFAFRQRARRDGIGNRVGNGAVVRPFAWLCIDEVGQFHCHGDNIEIVFIFVISKFTQ